MKSIDNYEVEVILTISDDNKPGYWKHKYLYFHFNIY